MPLLLQSADGVTGWLSLASLHAWGTICDDPAAAWRDSNPPVLPPPVSLQPQKAGDITYSIVRPTAFFKSLAGQVGAGSDH